MSQNRAADDFEVIRQNLERIRKEKEESPTEGQQIPQRQETVDDFYCGYKDIFSENWEEYMAMREIEQYQEELTYTSPSTDILIASGGPPLPPPPSYEALLSEKSIG